MSVSSRNEGYGQPPARLPGGRDTRLYCPVVRFASRARLAPGVWPSTLSAGMSFLDRSVDVNGINLHYVEWGDAGAPPLVLLHGITGHARTWDRLASGLVSRWHIIALDQRGHGDSDVAPDRDYGVGAMADDLAVVA